MRVGVRSQPQAVVKERAGQRHTRFNQKTAVSVVFVAAMFMNIIPTWHVTCT